MIKKLIISLLVLVTVSTTAFASTKALLQGSVTLATNVFATGTANLQISQDTTGSPTGFNSTSVVGFNDTIRPNHSKNYFFWLRNNETDGSIMALAGQATNSGSSTISGGLVTITLQPVDSTGTPVGGTTSTTGTLTQWISGLSFPVNNNLTGPQVSRSARGNGYILDLTIVFAQY
jgi:hypothetical protein